MMTNSHFDSELFELIPHRPPMLLINEVKDLNQTASSALVEINQQTPFFEALLGVPSWIGLEYMGQTAALIAGYQLREGLSKPHLGFLLGARHYKTEQEYFPEGSRLLVSCHEAALVGESLATFDCTISDEANQQKIASASLSVFRKPIDPAENN